MEQGKLLTKPPDVSGSGDSVTKEPSQSSVFKYQPLDYSRDSIRLLILERLGKYESPVTIRCQLVHVTFHQRPKYEALSYTWGLPEPTKTIFIDGEPVTIRKNPFTALRCLRHGEIDRYLWVDAICIDQNNLEERKKQVGIMDFIYTRASCVLVWLGLPGLPSSSDLPPTGLPFWDIDKTHRDWLLGNEYWRRVWIVQELGLARRLKVYTSSWCQDWDDFFRDLSLEILPPRKAVRRTEYLKDFVFIEKLDEKRKDRHGNSNRLETLLEDFQYAKCQDPRDKIYGFLGLAHDSEEGHIEANYSKPLFDLYAEVMEFFCMLRELPEGGLNRHYTTIRVVQFSQLVQNLLGCPQIPVNVFGNKNIFAVAAVGGVIKYLGPTYDEVYASSSVSKKWKLTFRKHFSRPDDIKKLREANEAYEILLFDQWEAIRKRVRFIDPLNFESLGVVIMKGVWDPESFESVQDVDKYLKSCNNLLRYGTGEKGSFGVCDMRLASTASKAPRLFLGNYLQIGLAPPEAREGDLICQFWRTNVVALVRKEARGEKFRIVGRADLSTGHLEDAKPVYQNWVAHEATADTLGLHEH
jgi:hypothetical protein